MVTYDTLKELALVLSKMTGYRYVSFSSSDSDDLIVDLSDSKMRWYPLGFWICESECRIFELRDLPDLDWSQCLFDCKEDGNE